MHTVHETSFQFTFRHSQLVVQPVTACLNFWLPARFDTGVHTDPSQTWAGAEIHPRGPVDVEIINWPFGSAWLKFF